MRFCGQACDRMKARQSLTHTVNKHLECVSTKYGCLYDGKPLDWELVSCSRGYIAKVFCLLVPVCLLYTCINRL